MDWVVAPVLQSHEVPADAVRVTFPPWQNESGPPAEIVAAGRALTVTVMAGEVEVQLPLVTVTV